MQRRACEDHVEFMACAFDVVRKDFGEQFDGELQRVATMVFQYNRFGNVGRRHVVGERRKLFSRPGPALMRPVEWW